MAPPQPHDVVEFGPFRLHLKNRRLLCGADEVQVGGRAMEMLLVLARKKNELVTKEDLFNAAWPGIFVHEANLKVTIASLRRSLREYSVTGNYIRTLVGRGYWLSDQQDEPSVAHDPDLPAVASTQFPELGTVIGRDAEIAELRETIAVNRLTTIVGAGGIGKTTVAVATAQLLEDEEGVSVTFIDFSRVVGEEFVIPSLAAALGTSSTSQDRLDAISSILARRKALLVLDTCEHVINAVAHLCDVIIANTKDVRILATSRQALRAKREEVLWLAPLDVPPTDRALTAEQVLGYSAPQLLVERASEKGPYTMDDRDAVAAAEICRRLDGSPLAIELIASRLAGKRATDVLEELGNRFSSLMAHEHDGPRRQQTLLATLQWSYALLTKSEAAVLRASSIFVGSFNMDALLRVAAHHDLDPTSIFDAIAGLRAKSMLSVEHIANEMRYRLLDSTRAFAGDLLQESGELAAVSVAYARYVLDLLVQAKADQTRLPARQWYATYAPRIDELRRAINWTLYVHGDRLLGLQLVAAGLPLWHELSLSEETRSNCELALAEFDRIGCTDMALKLKLVVGLAAVSSYLSADAQKAIDTIETAIRLSRDIGDTNAECQALGALARYRLLPGNRTEVQEILKQLKRVATRSNNRPALWEHQFLLTEVDIIHCQYAAAIARMEKLRQELRNVSDSSVSRFDLDPRIRSHTSMAAITWFGSCRPGTGLNHAKVAAREALEAHHGWTLIYAYVHGLLFVLTECEEWELSKYYSDLLKDTIYRHGMPAWLPVAHCHIEAIDAFTGVRRDPDGLMTAFDEIRTGLRQIGRHVYYALLVRALYLNGHIDEGVRILDYLFEVGPQRSMVPELLRLRAVKQRSVGRDEEALATLRQSLAAADENGIWAWRIRCATDLAILLRDQMQIAEARSVLEPLYDQFLDGFDIPYMRRARGVLSELQNFGRVLSS